MSDFIQIGDLIINKAQIVSAEYRQLEKTSNLYVTVNERSMDSSGGNNFFSWHNAQADELWQQLQHYLAPTVIQLNAPPPVIYTVGTISDEDSDIF